MFETIKVKAGRQYFYILFLKVVKIRIQNYEMKAKKYISLYVVQHTILFFKDQQEKIKINKIQLIKIIPQNQLIFLILIG